MNYARRLCTVVFPAFLALTPLATLAAGPAFSLRGPEVVKLDWNTRGIQSIDLDGDGLNDLAVINNDNASIDLLYQIKPGAPLPPAVKSINPNRWEPVIEDARFRKTSVTTGVSMFDLIIGDINSDGRPDLIYTGDPQSLTIRYQQADGGWLEKKISEAPTPLQFVGSMKLVDINGDKRTDLLIIAQKEIAVFLQDSAGQLSAPERYALPDDGCYGMELCDVNGDGRPDLVYLCSNNHDGLRVRLQTAQHQFGPELAYTMKFSRCTLQVLSEAGKKQSATFAYAQDPTGQLEVFSFAPTAPTENPVLRPRVFTPRSGSKTPGGYALGDFNHDGLLDVAVSDPDGAQVFVYLRQADNMFTSALRFPAFADARLIAAGDWDGDGQDELFISSPKEQAIGLARFSGGRLSYPQPLPISGKPLGLAAGNVAGDGRTMLAVLREEKGKRYAELWVRKDDGAECLKSIELTGLKTDPRAIRLVDADQDGRLDLAIFTPLDAMRLFIQKDGLEFTEASAATNFRKGLVDNLEAGACSVGDIDGDGKLEFISCGSGFARALRLNAKGELTVVDQFNARDPGTDISCALVLPGKDAKHPALALYDRKNEQFQILRANNLGLYQVIDATSAGKIDVVSSEVRVRPDGTAEAFVFGKDRFWWLPLGEGDYSAVTSSTHSTDLPDISYSDIIVGDLNNDGRPEVLCVDPHKNLIEVLSKAKDNNWESLMHFKIFEVDEHYQGRKGAPLEPRETIISDVTGDGKKDVILLVHDRVLIYPQE